MWFRNGKELLMHGNLQTSFWRVQESDEKVSYNFWTRHLDQNLHKGFLWLLEEKITPSSSDGPGSSKVGKDWGIWKKKKIVLGKADVWKGWGGKGGWEAICVAWVIAKTSVQRGQNAWEWEWSMGTSKVFESNPTKGEMGSGTITMYHLFTKKVNKYFQKENTIMKCRAETDLLY